MVFSLPCLVLWGVLWAAETVHETDFQELPAGLCLLDGMGCLSADGQIGLCSGGECTNLCQSDKTCGDASIRSCSDPLYSLKCCSQCAWLKSLTNECRGGQSCVATSGMQGTCENGVCHPKTTSCPEHTCEVPVCHSVPCTGDDPCRPEPVTDGTSCGMHGEVCTQGMCNVGLNGAYCKNSAQCIWSELPCKENVCLKNSCTVINSNGTRCGTGGRCREGWCIDTQECVHGKDGEPCSFGICMDGLCKEKIACYPEGRPCGDNKVCQMGTCQSIANCTQYDGCMNCKSVSGGKDWSSLRIQCYYDEEKRACVSDTGRCSAMVSDTVISSTTFYGTPVPNVDELGLKWKIFDAMMSTNEAAFPATNCFDGDTNTKCLSEAEPEAWLELDLSASLMIGTVRITNTGGYCGQRLVCGDVCGDLKCHPNPGFVVLVGDTSCSPDGSCWQNQCGQRYNRNCGLQHVIDIPCIDGGHRAYTTSNGPGMRGRYVRIVLLEDKSRTPSQRRLDVAEVEVFAPSGFKYKHAVQQGYSSHIGEPSPAPQVRMSDQGSFKPPDQTTTDQSSFIVAVALGISLILVSVVALYLKAIGVKGWWLRAGMFGAGVVRVYDWMSDILFFMYVSAIPDLGEVNRYSVAAFMILGVNLGVELCRLGWAIYGSRSGEEDFFWTGALVVVGLQIPGPLLAPLEKLSTFTYHSRMRDRWDWLTHMAEDVPQIAVASVYIAYREVAMATMLTLCISVLALLVSAVVKLRRRLLRDEFVSKQRAAVLEQEMGLRHKISAPNPIYMPKLEFTAPENVFFSSTQGTTEFSPATPPIDCYTDDDDEYCS